MDSFISNKDNIVSAAAYIFAKNENNSYSILCGKRSGNDPRHQGGLYDVPVGMREYGETPQQTAQRETMEETGINIPLNQFRLIEKQPWGKRNIGSNFLAILNQPLQIGQGDWEHEGFMWLPVEKVNILKWAYGMDEIINRYYNQFITMNKDDNNNKNTVMKESQLIKLIAETIKEKYEDFMGDGHNYLNDMQANAEYFSQTPEEYDDRIKDAQKYIDTKGQLAMTHHPQATPFRNTEKFGDKPEDSQSMDAYMDKFTERLDESDIRKIVTKTITKLIKEGKIQDPNGEYFKMGAVNAMKKLGAKEVPANSANHTDDSFFLSPRGAELVKNGKYVFNWTIEVGGTTFCSQHNFSKERYAEHNCNKYIKFLEGKLGCYVEAYVDSYWLNQDDDDTLGWKKGQVVSDTMLRYDTDLGGWMD